MQAPVLKMATTSIKHSITPTLLNITSLFDDFNPNNISADSFKNAIIDIYGAAAAKVVVTQFPDLLAVIAPELQISIIAEGRRVQVINQRSIDLEGLETEKFLKLVTEINKKMVDFGKINAFGLNYSGKIELTNGGSEIDSATLINNISINNISKIEKVVGSGIKSSSFHIVFDNGLDRLDLRLNPELTKDLSGTNKINAHLNVHIKVEKFPEYSKIVEAYKAYLTKFQQDCGAIMGLLV